MTIACSRRGIATLEYIFVFPILLGIVAAIILMARADVQKTAAVTAARADAWQKRANADEGSVMGIAHDPMLSRATGTAQSSVPRTPMFAPNTYTARGRTVALGRTWDSRSLPFRPTEHLEPHSEVLEKMLNGISAAGKVVGALGQAVGLSFALLSPERNPVIKAGGGAVDLIGNSAVIAAGFTLGGLQKLTSGLFDSLGDFLDAASDVIGFVPGLGTAIRGARKILRTIRMAFDFGLNLFEAAQGRQGVWISSALQSVFDRLTNFP